MALDSPPRKTRYYDFLTAAFVASLLCANLVNPAKLTEIFGFTVNAGVLFFPITYLFGDVLTEVYGFARARRAIWFGFILCAFATLNATIVVWLPPAEGWENQAAYETVFGSTWRVVLASLVGYWLGEMSNAYVLAKIKVWMKGRFLFVRTIGSTIVGEALDSLIFYHIAFYNLWDYDTLWRVILASYVAKVLWEILATPFTYRVIAFLKRAEGGDHDDAHTDFSLFRLSEADAPNQDNAS